MRCSASLLAALAVCLGVGCGDGSGGPSVDLGECRSADDCDDGIACTEDICSPSLNGVHRCDHVARPERCAPGEDCVATGAGAGCRDRQEAWCDGHAEGAACTPVDLCAEGAGTCVGGRCEYAVKACPARPCFGPGTCLRLTGECAADPLPAQEACDSDGRTCTPETCDGAGRCLAAGTPSCLCDTDADCPDDGDRCAGPATCERSSGRCVRTPKACPVPAESCRVATCESATGACGTAVADDGATCAAATTCLQAGRCRGGECVQEPVDCDDHQACTLDRCDPVLGCVNEQASNLPCDDGDACNGPDACDDGACVNVGPDLDCTPDRACRTGKCHPAQGCVFTDVAPCCGNAVVDEGGAEECDPGVETAGCGPDCRFRSWVAAPDGASMDLAWGASGGLLVVDRVPPVGARKVVAVPVREDGSTGADAVLAEAPAGSPPFWPAVSAFPDGTFAAAWYQDGLVTVRTISAAPRLATVSLGGETPGRRIVVAASAAGGLVAFGTRPADGSDLQESVRVARLSAGAQSLVLSPADVLAGDAAQGQAAFLGDACVGAAGTLVAWSQWDTTGPRTIVPHVQAFDPEGRPLGHRAFPDFATDMLMAPRCIARPGGYIVVLSVLGTTTAGAGTIELRTLLLDDAGASDTPFGVLVAREVAGSAIDLPLPFRAALAPMGDRFVYLVPFGAGPLDPGNVLGVSAMPPRVITVSDHGQPVGFPATLTAAPVFANDVAASAGPGVSALLAWLRGADLGLEEPAPAPVELRFTGRF